MKDITGRELETGQRVVFSVGTKLILGTVKRVRTSLMQGYSKEVAQVILEKPEARRSIGKWNSALRAYEILVKSEDRPPKTMREVFRQDGVFVLDEGELDNSIV